MKNAITTAIICSAGLSLVGAAADSSSIAAHLRGRSSMPATDSEQGMWVTASSIIFDLSLVCPALMLMLRHASGATSDSLSDGGLDGFDFSDNDVGSESLGEQDGDAEAVPLISEVGSMKSKRGAPKGKCQKRVRHLFNIHVATHIHKAAGKSYRMAKPFQLEKRSNNATNTYWVCVSHLDCPYTCVASTDNYCLH